MNLVPDLIVSLAETDLIGSGKNIVAGASVNITKAGGGSAQIYSDAAGTSLITLPTVTDASGELAFYIAAGDYIYTIAGNSYSKTISAKDTVQTVETWAAISAITPNAAGQVFTLKQHTSGGIGGGALMAFVGSVTDDGGTQKNCLGGFYLKRKEIKDLSIEDFGAIPGGADCTAAILLAKSYAVANRPKTINIPKGVYSYTDIGNWAYSGVSLRGVTHRESVMKCTSSAPAFKLDAFQAGWTGNDAAAPYILCSNVENITFEATSESPSVVDVQGLAFSSWKNVFARNCSTSGIGFHMLGVQENKFENLGCSVDIEGSLMTSIPLEGIRLEAGTRAGASVGNSSNNYFTSCYFDGLSFGIRLTGADQNTFISGASQSNLSYDVLIADMCRYNTFSCMGFESTDATANIADAGTSNKFINCYTNKSILLQGRLAEVNGGYHERIEAQSGSVKNKIHSLVLNNWRDGSGGFFDSGAATEWSNMQGTTFTATFATNVMTVTTGTQGVLAVGQEVYAEGVSDGTIITSFGTYNGVTGTVNLSTTPGTLTSRICSTNGFIYPFAGRTAITVTASPFIYTNTTGQYVDVIIQSGTVSQVRILRDGDSWIVAASSPQKLQVAPLDQVEVSYSVAPAMSYVPQNGFQG